MAKQHKRTKPKGKAQASKPITSHQLFPAVVALWFGALFGLGSLAVRPSLIESLVMKSRLDLVVPAAAPPLGITARMLIALVLGAIGAGIGIAIARRLGRPKVELRQRKRDKFSGDADARGYASRPDYATASLAHDELDAADERSGLLAGRRRAALAIEHEEPDFIPHEMAPLPGGAPQVLDITGVELGEYAPVDPEYQEPAPLDLGAFAQPAPEPFSPPPAFAPPVDAALAGRQVFQPAPPAEAPMLVEPPFAPTVPTAAPFTMPQAFDQAPQVFEAAPAAFAPPSQANAAPFAQPESASPEPAVPDFTAPTPASGRQIFGMAIEDDHVDQSFIRAAGFKTTVFEREEHEPLFPDRAPASDEAEAVFTVPVASPFETGGPITQAAEPVPAFAAPQVPVAAEPTAADMAAPVAQAPAAPLPPVAGLGMTDLASRLQQSMARRRAARTGEELPPVEAPQAAPIQAAAEPAPAPQPAPGAAFAIPQAFVASEPEVEAAPAFEAPRLTVPAPAPASSLLSPAPAHAEADPAAVVAPAPMAMPAALRPLSFDDHDDDADDLLASLLPPRHIAMPVPAPVITPVPAPVAQAMPEPAPFAAAPASVASEPAEAELGEEESYASLLDIGQPLSARSQFVRIEEPEAVDAPVEPVVIFPGQTPLASVPGEAEATPFRRFDAPSAAGQGGPVASATGLPATDPAEADQALRAALANLQRMSGAA